MESPSDIQPKDSPKKDDIIYNTTMKYPKAVFDTNVVVAAMRSRRGASNRLLELFAKGRIRVSISVPLILEYESVLRRQARELGLTVKDVTDFIDFFCKVGEKQEIHFMWRPALRDPDDDMVLELGVAAGADIVTFNTKDFGAAGRYGVRVYEPGTYLRKVEGVK